ncbi:MULTISPECIES: LCP family protein [unclassified Arthrobacter]|uniref:LCP family protein n=1 Tax=unclassified Arthrobacter TaxID=235627 RepID=UPI001492CB46|nr:LCP family protein [Arthrobacter sp. AET 35A]MBE0010351.1 LytR family transcriptional regulator [Arthrobacter sp. AET 35A]NOJ64192.1 LCP family protein [Arthrobacter sp. 147(2020)]
MSNYLEEPVQPRARKKRPVRLVLFSALALVLVACLVTGGYLFNLASTYNAQTQTIEEVFPEGTDRPTRAAEAEGALNILLLGSDENGGSGETENLPGVPNEGRSDTMMLMHIPADREGVYVMSIMRDTWTDIPGYGEHKINAATAFGGVPLLVETVEGLFDAPIDHVAIIDFEGFTGLTDALGGVEVNNEIAFQSRGADGEFFAEGPITLQGESALKFVRERYAFTDGDYQRVKNQQLFIQAVMGKFLTADTLSNPLKINEIVGQVSPYLSVDEGLDASAAGSLALSLRNVRSNDVEFFTLPNLGIGTSADGQSIIVKDDAAIAEIAAALDTDTLGDYVETASQ